MTGALPPRLLASDLDGTLIPVDLDHASARRFRAWRERHPELRLAYLTGRHLELALRGIEEHLLPRPDFFGCDVGTSLYRRDGERWSLEESYRDRMRESWSGCREIDVLETLYSVPGLAPQDAERNSEFKTSFTTAGRDDLAERVGDIRAALAQAGIEAHVVASLDPAAQVGLIDVLPPAASKQSALAYLQELLQIPSRETVFAGDSGNDFDALLHGGPAILVGNAPEDLRRRLRDAAGEPGAESDLYLANGQVVEGVLEGLAHFGLG